MPRRVDKYEDEGDIWDDEPPRRSRRSQHDPEDAPRAPLLLRLLAWVGIILLCFVGGYLGTSWAIKMLGEQGLLAQKDVVKSTEELNKFLETDNAQKGKTPDQIDAKKLSLQLYYPKENALDSEPFDIITSLKEDDIQETLKKVFLISEMFTKDVSIKHVFRNAGVLFIDVAGPFIPKLAEAGKEQSALFVTGIVRTMKENFPPTAEVRFLVNGEITTAGSPIDLTVPWKLPQ